MSRNLESELNERSVEYIRSHMTEGWQERRDKNLTLNSLRSLNLVHSNSLGIIVSDRKDLRASSIPLAKKLFEDEQEITD